VSVVVELIDQDMHPHLYRNRKVQLRRAGKGKRLHFRSIIQRILSARCHVGSGSVPGQLWCVGKCVADRSHVALSQWKLKTSVADNEG
jgi:hypothetical protein